MKFPTIEEMAQDVADKALDEIEYKGKTLRQWIEIILATDNNVGTKLSTNLAEVGTDCISRQAAVDALTEYGNGRAVYIGVKEAVRRMEQLPSAQPEIIHCNSCKYWTQSTGKMKGYGLGRCDFHDADLVTCNGFCYWAERRNDG